jgi:RNA-directed DNA polymerase
LSHIYFVKARRDRDFKTNKDLGFTPPKAVVELYKRFLFFKHFVMLERPLIVTEGISDIVYMKAAIKSLAAVIPGLTEVKDGRTVPSVKFLTPSGTARTILNLGQGTAGQTTLISDYKNRLKKYTHKPLKHPVIVLCDNDLGPKEVFAKAAAKSGGPCSISTTEPFYFLGDNLYLVKVPEGVPPASRDIEDLFPAAWLATPLNGKPFDKKKEHGDDTAYGKVAFAEQVVRPNADKIDFSQFTDLLQRIDACVLDYKAKVAATAAPVAVPPVAAAGGSP